jgi:hypothetical protein
MKITVFWNISVCSLIQVDGRFRDAYCLHRQGDAVFIMLHKNLSATVVIGGGHALGRMDMMF